MARLRALLAEHPTATGIALVASSLVVLLFAGVILGGMLAGGQAGMDPATPSPSLQQTLEPTASDQPAPTVSAAASSAAASPSPSRDELVVGNLAKVVTTDLVVRSAPGTGEDSVIQPNRLTAPIVVFVVDGPVMADGYTWYLVDPIRDSPLGDFPTAGWAAAGGKDGEPWLSPDATLCPESRPTTLIGLPEQRGLRCFGDSTQTVEGTLRICSTHEDIPDLLSEVVCDVVRPGFDVTATPDPSCGDCFEPWLRVAANSDVGLATLAPGTNIRIEGHYDDSSADQCAGNDLMTGPPELRVHACRLIFWVTAFEFL